MPKELTIKNEYNQEQINLITRTIAKGASKDELALFIGQCKRTGLDPFSRQIYCIARKEKDKETGQYVQKMSTQVSIDGLRLVAQRSKEYEGQTPTEWCGDDGVWVDVWLKKIPPTAARVGVYRANFKEPLIAVAKFESYKPSWGSTFWDKMPDLMIGKVAEALALRKAFPQELSGLYTTEEMNQSEVVLDNLADATEKIEIKIAEDKKEKLKESEKDNFVGEVEEIIDGQIYVPVEESFTPVKDVIEHKQGDASPQKHCPICGKYHNGKYAKCYDCWKSGATAPATKTIQNPNKPF